MLKPLSLVCHPPLPRPPPPPFWVEVRSSPRIFLLCRVVASGWRLIFWRCLVAVARGGVCSKKKNDFCELSGNMAGENANFSDKNVGKFWILGLGVISAVYFVMVCQKNDFYNHFSAFIWCFLVILFMSRKIFWRFSVILTSLVKQFDVFGCFRFFLSLKCVQKGAAACWWVRLQRWYQTKDHQYQTKEIFSFIFFQRVAPFLPLEQSTKHVHRPTTGHRRAPSAI